jgi:vacuolar-type H+-ATPase subunit H
VDDRERGTAVVGDAIERIKEAEKRAEETRRQGRSDRKRVVAEAHEAAERLLDETRKGARETERERIEAARRDAEREAERMASEGQQGVEGLRGVAESKVESAVTKVLSKITAAA